MYKCIIVTTVHITFNMYPIRLDCVMNTEELADVHAHFSLYYGRDVISMQNSQVAKNSSQDSELDKSLDTESGSKDKSNKGVRQANKNDFYAKCQENGLGSLAAKYGLTSEQFGENLRDNYQRHETEQHTIEPEESAEDYVQTIGLVHCVILTVVIANGASSAAVFSGF